MKNHSSINVFTLLLVAKLVSGRKYKEMIREWLTYLDINTRKNEVFEITFNVVPSAEGVVQETLNKWMKE